MFFYRKEVLLISDSCITEHFFTKSVIYRKKTICLKCLIGRSALKQDAREQKTDMLEQRKLEELFRQNYSKMIHLASVLLGDGGEAEDVVQDIFLKLADSDIQPQNDSYLLTAVRNACLNRIRQMQVHQRVRNLLPIETETDQLPIFHLRFDEDLTIAEIARRLNLNPNTTYKYLMQSIQKIKNHFKQGNYERGKDYPAASGNA